MRQTVKLLHSLSSCGLIGALLGYMIVLLYAPQSTPAQYADARQIIDALCQYLLLPSLAISLISGLISMVVHKPFMDKAWVWFKALLGLGMFESTLAVINTKATYAAKISAQIAAGTAEPNALDKALSNEWMALWVIMALSVANFVLGIWRPKLKRRSYA
jgi:uncharacterized membrane protein